MEERWRTLSRGEKTGVTLTRGERWQTKPLGELIQLVSGQHIDAKDYNTESRGVGYLTGPSDFGLVNPIVSKWTERPKIKSKRGDILITVKGSGVGKINLLDQEEVAISRQLMAVRVTAADPRFIYAFLSSTFDYFQSESTGAAIPGISREQVLGLRIAIPPLPEQQRIVGILDEAFEGIATAKANAEKNLQNARALFDSHLQSVFAQRGECWVEDLVGSICDVKHGFAFDGAEFSSNVSAGNPVVITPGNFTEDGRLLFNEKNTKRFNGDLPVGFLFDIGDLVVVMTDLSSKMKILGKPAFVETDGVLHNQRIGRVVFKNDRIEKRFLYYFMMSEDFLKNIKESATGTMVKHTAPKRILSNAIPFPRDRGEQLEIINRLDSLREETQRLESIYQQKLGALDALKRSLLHQAFSGHL
jgi:type I restriction enzyme S subunit